ncbi:MAG: ParA family protein [Asgard group archaeon]|nr:ParA family protein [Asgard group archaeon]
MKTIILHSYKGGTGKTTLALNIAINFAKKGYKILAIDADLNAPTFESIFTGLKPKFKFNDFFETQMKKTKADAENKLPTPQDLPVKSLIHENLDLIFANSKPQFGAGLLSMDKNFHAEALKKLYFAKSEFEKMGYDYIIMDTSPSLNLASINSIIIADASLVVLRPNKYGIAGTTFLLKELYSMLGTVKRKDYIIFNQIVVGTPSKLVNQWKKHFKKRIEVETIGAIHCNCSIALNMLFGNLIVEDDTETEFLKAIDKIVDKLRRDLKN